MGHQICYGTYEENVNKRAVMEEWNEVASRESDYGGGLYREIQWIDHICKDYDDAYQYIEDRDNTSYGQLAVKYREYPKLEPTKTLLNLKQRHENEVQKKSAYIKAHSVSTFKAEYIGCPVCGSKLKRTLLRSENCPLCRAELRSKTTIDTLARYDKNIKELEKKIKDEERKVNEKNMKKSKIKWLVKVEFHV